MRFITWASSRALITVAATGAAISIGLLAGTAPAWAHVRVDADNPTPQPTPPGGAEPEYPAPELALAGAKADAADDHPVPVQQTTAPDNSARWLAGGALAVAAVAVATALLVRRRA